ncbi:flagellar biosynthesis protein FlhF [Pigmentiphaga soli]|uniref:Flagellar biosynthesis protein FlhF n=1 Tax=Pigmentiphaga soli TaxID=1007095 RepID=A0ABP8HTY6_9BURK
MAFRKFVAASTRDCLRMMREALGGDAMIVSTRRTAGGVEVVGVRAQDLPDAAALRTASAVERAAGAGRAEAAAQAPRPAANLWDGIEDDAVRLSPAAKVMAERDRPQPGPASAARLPLANWPRVPENHIAHLVRSRREYASVAHELAVNSGGSKPVVNLAAAQSESERRLRQTLGADEAAEEASPTGRAPVLDSEERAELANQVSEPIVTEMRSMRSWLKHQIEIMAWRDATQRDSRRRVSWRVLVDAGFTPALARTIASRLPEGHGEEHAQQWLTEVLVRNLHTVGAENGIIERGGRYAIIGPTGVGKTTTAAKIAAHCVVKYGAASLGLITTDQNRIGAVDQLRIFGQILGVQVYTARGEEDLDTILAGMADRRLVLIDTAGLGQRDEQIAEHQRMLAGAGVERLLVLPAGSHAEQAEDIVQAYGADGLAGLVVSKLDEAVRLGGALDAAIRYRLPLFYVTNGQRVPEDIHAANARLLAYRALRVRNASVFALDPEELDWAHMPSSMPPPVATQAQPAHAGNA